MKAVLTLLVLISITLSGCSNLGNDSPLGGKCGEVQTALAGVKDLANSLDGKKVVNFLLYEIDKASASRSLETAVSTLGKFVSSDVGGEANFQLIQRVKGNLLSISQYLDGSDLFKLVDLGSEYRSNAAEVLKLCQTLP